MSDMDTVPVTIEADRRPNAAALVVVLLGATLLLALAGIVLLAYAGKPTPDVLQMVAVGALTGLSGVLSPGLSKS